MEATMPQPLKLHSGSTLLNLACSGEPDHALLTGGYYWMVGESSSGKTFLARTMLAEASINPAFAKYDLIYDDVERGAKMDDMKFFGPAFTKRLQGPVAGEKDTMSRTVEEFYFHLDTRVQAARKRGGKPFIYVLDSMDSLDTDYAEQKFQEQKDAWEKDKEAKGDYGDGKAKFNSTRIRRVVGDMEELDSILIVLSQVRDNPAAKLFQPKSVTAGGKSLKHYANWQCWTTQVETLTRRINGADRQVGIRVKIQVKKNRLSGKEWPIELPIYWSYGIADLESCVDFLTDEKTWKMDRDKEILAPQLDFSGKRAELIDLILRNRLQSQVQALVVETWRSIERQCVVQGESRYHPQEAHDVGAKPKGE
jgi:RecA/RadA recombinase